MLGFFVGVVGVSVVVLVAIVSRSSTLVVISGEVAVLLFISLFLIRKMSWLVISRLDKRAIIKRKLTWQ